MTIPIRPEGAIKLQEGLTFNFLLRSVVTLQDQKQYLILEDPDGIKHFLDEEPYKHYHLKAGTTIRCRVEKINCTGRVFLEPEHPLYHVGSVYRFRIMKYDLSNGCLHLTDKTGMPHFCPLDAEEAKIIARRSGIYCKVIGIHKGVLDLFPTSQIKTTL
jgi:hypothetical protein